MELRTGIRIDRYVLLDRLGTGAQGSVWRVRDPLDNVEKALKLFNLAKLSRQGAERARREAQALAKLQHPSIVTCHALFELPSEERLGLVFDLVRGSALTDAAHDARMTSGHRDSLLVQLAAALEHVHARGIVHRDLKPANVLVADGFWNTPDAPGSIKLVDFGIAAAVGNPQGLTASGAFIGTRPYLAPDLLLPGRWSRAADGFTRDIFAFGVLAWELFTREHPTGLRFDAPIENFAAAYREAAEGSRRWPPAGLSCAAASLVVSCLALDPDRRPRDGAALSAALRVQHGGRASAAPAFASELGAPTDVDGIRTDAERGMDESAPCVTESIPIASTTQRPLAATEPLASPRFVTALVQPPSSGVTPVPSVDTSQDPRAPSIGVNDSKRRLSPAWWLAVGIAGAIVIAGLVSYLVAGAMLQARAPGVPPSPRVTNTSPALEVAAPAPIPCCGEGASCKSGRQCTPGSCSSKLPERWWQLRVTGVAMRSPEQTRTTPGDIFPEDLARTHPYARVCLRRMASPGSAICVSILKAARTRDGDRDDRLRVRTSDLESGAVEIWVEDGGIELARGTSAPNERGITTTALCRGTTLYAGPRDAALARVFAYLDDG